MTSWIFPKECICSIECCANLEVWLLFRKERLYSLYLVMKSISVCPMYVFLQSVHVSLYTPESKNLSGFWVLCILWFSQHQHGATRHFSSTVNVASIVGLTIRILNIFLDNKMYKKSNFNWRSSLKMMTHQILHSWRSSLQMSRHHFYIAFSRAQLLRLHI